MIDKPTKGTQSKPTPKKQGGTMVDTKTPIIKKEEAIQEKPVELPRITAKPEKDLVVYKEKLKKILKTAPMKPNSLEKRYMYETWFPQYEQLLSALAALAA